MNKTPKISFFDKYLTVWVIICMVIGIIISQYFPLFIEVLSKFEYAQISIPMAILIWIMIYPMMLKIDFNSIKRVKDNLRAIL
ncbi:MAG: arsenical-resistance protein, partial [Methanosphaera sp. rholeuAM130]